MISLKKNYKFNFEDIIAFLIMFLITAFPIFGKYGMYIQNMGLWILGILGIMVSLVNGSIRFNRIMIGYMLYIVFSLISLFWCIKIGGAYTRLIDMIQVLGIGCFFVFYCNYEDRIQKLLNCYVLGTVLISIYCLLQDISTFRVWSRLGKVVFENAGQNQIYYSCILIYATMILLYRVFESEERKWIYSILFIFLYGCGLLTAIKKCLIVPIVFACCYLLFKHRKHAIKLIIYFILLVVVCLIGYYIIARYIPSMYNRLQAFILDITSERFSNVNGNSFTLRKWLREQAWEQFKLHPIIGVGIGQFRYYAAAGGADLYSHNNFLEILANTGIIGFLIYYGNMLVLLVKSVYSSCGNDKSRKSKGYFVTSFLVSVFIMEYGQVDYYQLFFIGLVIIMCCLVDDYKVEFIWKKTFK